VVTIDDDPRMKALEALMRKWSLLILKDMFMGAKRFNDFLEMNEYISNKVLSDQLRNLEKHGFIEKVVVSTTPLRAEYLLTEKGRGLNKLLYELMVYARDYWFQDDPHFTKYDYEEIFGIE
jgi:DNA-binding HxlR family transcriptional regulator